VDYTVGGFFRRQINDLYQYETVPGFAAWSELPGSANAVNQYNLANGLGLPAYANFADYLQQYNGGTRPSALSPIDENYTYARNSGSRTARCTASSPPFDAGMAGHGRRARVLAERRREPGADHSLRRSAVLDAAVSAEPHRRLGTTLASASRTSTITVEAQHELRHPAGTARLRDVLRGFRHGGANANAIGTCAFCDSPNTPSSSPTP